MVDSTINKCNKQSAVRSGCNIEPLILTELNRYLHCRIISTVPIEKKKVNFVRIILRLARNSEYPGFSTVAHSRRLELFLSEINENEKGREERVKAISTHYFETEFLNTLRAHCFRPRTNIGQITDCTPWCSVIGRYELVLLFAGIFFLGASQVEESLRD